VTPAEMLVHGAVGGGAIATGQPLVAVPYGFSAIMAQSLMNPKGWVREWLTTGTMSKIGAVAQQLPKIVHVASKDEQIQSEAQKMAREGRGYGERKVMDLLKRVQKGRE